MGIIKVWPNSCPFESNISSPQDTSEFPFVGFQVKIIETVKYVVSCLLSLEKFHPCKYSFYPFLSHFFCGIPINCWILDFLTVSSVLSPFRTAPLPSCLLVHCLAHVHWLFNLFFNQFCLLLS